MHFSVSSRVFLQHVQKAQTVVERRNTIPILLNVYLDVSDGGVNLAATDLDVGVRDRFEAEVSGEGAVTVSAKKLFEILKELPDDLISFQTADNNWVEIVCGGFQTKIMGLPPDDYPELPDTSSMKVFELESAVLEEMIEQSAYAISNDENRYVLNGVLTSWEGGLTRMVATDGHRLALVERPGEMAEGLRLETILSAKCLKELRRMLREGDGPIGFGTVGNHLVFRQGQEHLIARMVEGQFPDYQQVIPDSFAATLVLPRDHLVGILRRVSLLADQKDRGIRLQVREGVLEISASSAEYGTAREELEIEYQGATVAMGFNASYLLDSLRPVQSENLVLEFNDASSPVQVRPVEDEAFRYRAVVMPMVI